MNDQQLSARRIALPHDRSQRVYVAGPMTGYPEHNYPAFHAAAADLRDNGFSVVNPAEHGMIPGAEWEDYLRHDLAGLCYCESIFLLKGWSGSRGARLELLVAKELGLQVLFDVGAERPARKIDSK